MPDTNPNPQSLSLQLEQTRRTVAFDSYDFALRQLVDMIASGEINIAPEYQRKFVWEPQRQSEFIESVFLGIPTPSLFMATNRDSTWEVVDGVQRLSTIVNFCGADEVREHLLGEKEPLRLCGLKKLSDFNGKTFLELPKSIQLGFQTRMIRITTLNDKSDMGVRFDLFERLNSGGVKLEPQEIRNCVYRGKFNDLLKELAKNEQFRKLVKVSANDKTNGTYEEMVLRFFAFLQNYKKFQHGVTEFLNTYMEQANKDVSV